ncbi:MAG: serine/threonine protein kinase [Myxococcota bacterium]
MEKFCPMCGRSYPNTGPDICEDDGERLVAVAPTPDLIGTTLEGKYEISGQLGEGGMGTVYLAHQASMGRDVAIKVLRPEYSHNRLAIKRFHREARAASRLAHPNTITVYDSGQSEEGLLYQVIELLKGQPLSDILENEGPLDPHRAIRIVAQICDSLAEAHEAGIIHRDLKPENIFIEAKYGNPEFVKVLDFGIAKIADADITQATKTGMICGTPSYMSPEQAMGRELDGRSDIYSLGILLWELLEDRRPFEGNTPMEVMLKHINEPVPGVPEPVQGPMRGHLKGLFEWVMAKPPQKRPQTCQELKSELLKIAAASPEGGVPVEVHHTTTMDTESPDKSPAGTLNTGLAHSPAEASVTSPSRKIAFGIAAAALLGLGAVAAMLSTGTPEAEPVKTAEAPAATAEASGQASSTPPEVTAPDAPDDAKVAEPEGGEEAPKSPEMVTVTIRSTPLGAEVFDIDGALLGLTPVELKREKGAEAMTLTFKKEGYADRSQPVDPSKSLMWSVTLAKVAPATKTAKPTKPRRSKGSRKAKSTPAGSKSAPSGKSGFGTF